jgi:flagellar basal-body rod protein FlgF
VADGIYVGMSAAIGRAAQLDAIADNLANIESPGFKGVRPAFSSFLPPGGPTDKVLSGAVATTIDMRPGTTQTTDSPTDVIPDGNLMLAVQMPGGKVAYTRNGHIEVGPDGGLQIAGLPVLEASGDPFVVPENSEVTIESTGEVRAGTVRSSGSLSLWNSQGPMDRVGSSLMMPSTGTQMNQVTDGSVRVGELELGNVTALESTVQMIGAQRNYELAMQAIQTYRQLDQRVVEVGRAR